MRWFVLLLVAIPVLALLFSGIATTTGHTSSGQAWLRALRYLLAAELAALLLVAIAGVVYEARSRKQESQLYHSPGKLLDVGGYRLHLHCSGSGGPTVLLEAGLTGTYLDWYLVQPEVARFARVCSYDRGGYGWSDSSPKPRLPGAMTEEFHALLAAAGQKPPYIFVAHSFGAFDALMYAHKYREELAGLILVDGTHPDQTIPFPWRQRLWTRMMQLTMPFGLPRWRRWCTDGPPEIAGMKAAVSCRSSFFAALYAQRKFFPGCAAEVRTLGSLGSLPLVIISRDPERGRPSAGGQTWTGFQKQLATLSTDSTHVVAEGSSHAVPLDRPDVIVESIRRMAESRRVGPRSQR